MVPLLRAARIGSEQLLGYPPKFGLNFSVEVVPAWRYFELTFSCMVVSSRANDSEILRRPIVWVKHGELHGCLGVQYPFELLHLLPVCISRLMATLRG